MKYSGAYLSNINDYSIKENQEMNPYNKGNLNKNISKRSVLSKQSHLFCKDVINNDMPALFYKIYDYNKTFCTPKNKLTPPKKINFYSFSSKK